MTSAADLDGKNATITSASQTKGDPYSANSDCDTATTSYCTYDFPIPTRLFSIDSFAVVNHDQEAKTDLALGLCIPNLQSAKTQLSNPITNPGKTIMMRRTGRTTPLFWSTIWLLWPLLFLTTTTTTLHAFTSPLIAGRWTNNRAGEPDDNNNSATRLTMANKNPTTFREAEVLGLKLMQEQKYAEALVGMCVVR
jgi:hypothetical protein